MAITGAGVANRRITRASLMRMAVCSEVHSDLDTPDSTGRSGRDIASGAAPCLGHVFEHVAILQQVFDEPGDGYGAMGERQPRIDQIYVTAFIKVFDLPIVRAGGPVPFEPWGERITAAQLELILSGKRIRHGRHLRQLVSLEITGGRKTCENRGVVTQDLRAGKPRRCG